MRIDDYNMTPQQSTDELNCHSEDLFFAFSLFLVIFALPVHILLIKILWKDAQLDLPRHKIMFSLAVSDSLQIFIVSISVILRQIFSSDDNHAVLCHAQQYVVTFFSVLTVIVSSSTIVALSVERYISCIHTFYLHHIMTPKRTLIVLGTQWIVALCCATLAVSTRQPSLASTSESIVLRYSTVVIVIPSAIFITAIQVRLFIFSRSKLVRVAPTTVFGRQAELLEYRKKELKVTFVASVVAVSYIICMLPSAILFSYELIHKDVTYDLSKYIFALAFLNTLVDPLIYGVGIKDTRKMMWKNIKMAKDFLLWQIIGL